MPGNNTAEEGRQETMRKGGKCEAGWASQIINIRLDYRLSSIVLHTTLRFCCQHFHKSAKRFRRSRCTQKMIIFPNGLFSFRLLALERELPNTSSYLNHVIQHKTETNSNLRNDLPGFAFPTRLRSDVWESLDATYRAFTETRPVKLNRHHTQM